MFDISYPVAFSAGVISFFAPCVLPLLPAYIGYVTGVSITDLREKGYRPYLGKILSSSMLYVLGFSLVFVLLGSAVAGIGATFRRHDVLIQRMGGLLILVLGLDFAGIYNIAFLAKERRLKLANWLEKLGGFRSFMVGVIFALAWTPCVGVVLGSILTLAAVSGTAARGASLLLLYSLGISVPFLIVSLTLASAPKYIKRINKHIGTISKAAGIMLAILGLLLLTNTYRYLNSWLFQVAFKLGYEIR